MWKRTCVCAAMLLAIASQPATAQSLGGCPMFPANNVWNTPVDNLPVDSNSAAYISSNGTSKYLHPDFSASGGGIPYVVVPSTQPKVPIQFGDGASESDPGPYPVPANAPVEGGASSSGDRHVLVLQSGSCMLYELYAAYPQSNGSWQASSGAVFNLNSNQLRPAGWTSADAGGFAILPGLVRYDEVASGEIRHAIRMTVPHTRNQYIWPARHKASSLTGTQYPPMGQRFRLKASFDISGYPADVQVILKALKKYGAIIADNGSAWYLTGAPDSRWNDDSLHKLHQVLGSNLEAVDESSLMTDPNSGVVLGGMATLNQVRLGSVSSNGGATIAGNQVVLSAPAPAGGVSVSLQSSNPAAASVPASVLVAGGETTASFPIQTSDVATTTLVTITAFYLGVTATASLTVLPAPPAGVAPSSVVLSPATTQGGTAVNCYLYLSGPAPAGGQTVVLTSSNPSVASVPASVTFPAGASLKYTVVTVPPALSQSSITVTMSANGVSKSATLVVKPASLSRIQLSATSVKGGGTITGTLVLGGIAAAPLIATLTSFDPSVVVPKSVTISTGNKTGTFPITTKAVAATTKVKVTVQVGGVIQAFAVTVTP